MATKVPQVVKEAQQEQTTALAMLQQTETPMVQVTEDKSLDLFPQLKMVHPIEIKPDSPFKPEHAHVLGLFDGKTFTPLAAPYTICVFAGRNAARKLVTDEEGEKSYERAYAALNTRGKSHDRYVEMCKEEEAQVGASMVCFVWLPDGSATMAEFPLFKTAGSYWKNKLLQAQWAKKTGLKVLISSHYENQTTGRSGNAYLSDKKFTQCETAALTEPQMRAVVEVAKKYGSTYEAWLDR